MLRLLLLIQFILLSLIILVFNPISVRIYTLIIAKQNGLNVRYFYNQIEAESSFRCFIHSYVNAIGPGQVTKETAAYIQPDLNPKRLWLPWDNLAVSAKYTQYLLNKYKGNYSLALAAYNWGETNVDNKLKYHNINIVRHLNYRYLFKNVYETDAFIKKILE